MKKKANIAIWMAVMIALLARGQARAAQEGRLDINVRNIYNEKSDAGVMEAPYAVEVGASGDVYIADAANNRIIRYVGGDAGAAQYYPPALGKVTSDTGTATIGVGTTGTGTIDPKILAYARVDTDMRLFRPVGVAVDQYFIYVADTGNGRVVALKIMPDKTLGFSHAIGYFKNVGLIKDIATDGKGNLFLLDSRNGRVLKYSYTGQKMEFASGTTEIGGLLTPSGLTLDAQGNIYVADTTHHKVLKYGPDGKQLLSFGEKGKGDGYLFYPQDVAVNAKGDIFVADTENNRIDKFLADGTYAGYFGGWGREKGRFFHNRKIAFGWSGDKLLLYAADTSLWRVSVIEIEPNLTIVHTPYKYITANPLSIVATIETKLTETSGLKMVYRLNSGATSSFQIPETAPNSFKGNATIAGLTTGQKFTYRLEAETTTTHSKNNTDYYVADVDMDPPTILNARPADNAFYKSGQLTISADYYDVGTGVASESVKLYLDGAVIATQALAITRGHVEFSTDAVVMAEGYREIKIVVGDIAGNVSTKTLHVTVDRTPPTISFDENNFTLIDVPGQPRMDRIATSGFKTVTRRLRITGGANDANMDYYTVKVRCGGATAAWTELERGYGNLSSPNAMLAMLDSAQYSDGVCNLMAVAVDKAGNAGNSAMLSVEIDNTPPAAAIAQPFFGAAMQTLNLAGGNTEIVGMINEKNLNSYKIETLEGPATNGCGGSGWATLSEKIFSPIVNVAANHLEVRSVWRLTDPPEPGVTRVYSMRFTARDAYQSDTYCGVFNVGLSGIVITPLPAQDMATNKIKYDLSDGGAISVNIVRAVDESKLTNAQAFSNPLYGAPVKYVIQGVRQPKGVNEVVWDGKDYSGNNVPDTGPGYAYYYLITAVNDANYTSYALGKVKKTQPPSITALAYSPLNARIEMSVTKEMTGMELGVYNTQNMLVVDFKSSDAVLVSSSGGSFAYAAPWNGTNKYGRPLDQNTYTIRLKVEDANGNIASRETQAVIGSPPPSLTANIATRKRTAEIRNLNAAPVTNSWPTGSVILISKGIPQAQSQSDAILASLNKVGFASFIKATKFLQVSRITSEAPENYYEWNGRVYDPRNTSVFVDEPCAPNCEFFVYNASGQLVGYDAQSIVADTVAPTFSIVKQSVSGDIIAKISVTSQTDYLKSYMLSIYDLEANLVQRTVYTAGETWTGTAGLPVFNWERRVKDITYSSSAVSPSPTRTGGVKINIQGVDEAGNVGATETYLYQPADFTADTGAVVISADRNAMLRVPPGSVTNASFPYSSLRINQAIPLNNKYDNIAPPTGVVFLGKVYNFGPSGTTFSADKPAILRLYYTVDAQGYVKLDGVYTGVKEKYLSLYYFNETKRIFERWAGATGIENSGAPQERRYLWVPLTHLSTYFLTYNKDVSPPYAAITDTSPKANSIRRVRMFDAGTSYSVIGTAMDAGGADANPIQWTLEYGKGQSPTDWALIATSTTPISSSRLGVWDTTGFSSGYYQLKLTVRDSAGNVSSNAMLCNFASVIVDPVLDTTPPVINIMPISSNYISPANTSSSFKQITLAFSLIESATVTIRVVDTSGRVIKTLAKDVRIVTGSAMKYTYTGNTDSALYASDGRAKFEITATDNAKNKTINTSSMFVIDSTAPSFSGMIPAIGSLAMSLKPAISVIVSDSGGSGIDPLSVYVLYNNSYVSRPSIQLISPGVYRISFIPNTVIRNGINYVYISIKDYAGNTGNANWYFYGDRTNPNVRNLAIKYSPFSPVESIDRKDECVFTANIYEKTGFVWSLDITDTSGTRMYFTTGSELASSTGGPFPIRARWDGARTWINQYGEPQGVFAADGVFNYTLRVTDAVDNTTTIKDKIIKDDTPPVIGYFGQSKVFFSPFTSSPVKTVSFGTIVTEANYESANWSIVDMDNKSKEVVSRALFFNGNSMASVPLSFGWDGLLPGGARAHDGNYGVILAVYDSAGNVSMRSGAVVLDNTPPVANPGPDIIIDESAVPYILDASRSTDDVSGVRTYYWDLNNDGMYEKTGATQSVVYPDNTLKTVKLRVYDNAGLLSPAASLKITVRNVPPSADAGPDRTIRHGTPVAFTGVFTDPGTLDTQTFSWNFGDGSTSVKTKNTSHYYSMPGVYETTLQVMDKDGGVGTDTAIITVAGQVIVTNERLIPSIPAQYEEPYIAYTVKNLSGQPITEGKIVGRITPVDMADRILSSFTQKLDRLEPGTELPESSQFSPINATAGEYALTLYYQSTPTSQMESVLRTKILLQECIK